MSRVVDGSDFRRWNTGKYTNTLRWDRGNFNGDATVDASDFGIWNTFKFQASDEYSALPEPQWAHLGLALVAYGLLGRWR